MAREGQSTENGTIETKEKSGHCPSLQSFAPHRIKRVHKLWAGITPRTMGRKPECCNHGLTNSEKFGCARERHWVVLEGKVA